MSDALSNGLSTVATFVPKLVLFLVILVIGWVVAKAVAKLVDTVLERVGFDRAIERGGVGKALAKSTYDPSDILAKLVYYAILLFTLQLAFGVFGPNPISDLIQSVIAFLPKVFVAIIIVVLAAAIAAAVRELIANSLGGLSYGNLLANIASAFIIGIGVIAALNQVDIATTVTTPILVAVLATIAGILVVGVGGGLVRPMQHRWEGWLDKAEAESDRVAEEVRKSPDATEQAKAAKAKYDQADERASDTSERSGAQQRSSTQQRSGTQASAGAHTAHSAAQTERTSEIRTDTGEQHQSGRDDLFRR